MGLKKAYLIVDALESTDKFVLKEGLPLEDPEMDGFRKIYQFSEIHVCQWQFWAIFVVLDICGLLNFLVQALFCLASTMGELGPAICAGNFKDVIWFTFCYNEVNANCFLLFKFLYFTCFWKGENKGSE